MVSIVLMLVVFIICYIMNFPGGPTGFAVALRAI